MKKIHSLIFLCLCACVFSACTNKSNISNTGEPPTGGETGNVGDEDAPSFRTREEYNKILKDMGFNRTRI